MSKPGEFLEQLQFSDVIIPPFRFASVETDIFRGAYPTLRNYRYLARLKLKTVISLTPEPPIADVEKFCQEEGISVQHINAEKSNAEVVPLTVGAVSQALTLLIAPGARPAYVHCLDGGCTTGCLMLCLRKLQHWAPASAHAEFQRFSGDQELPRFIEVFARDFVEEVTIKETVPPWLWGGDRSFYHPSIKITHDPPLLPSDDHNVQKDGGTKANKGKDTSQKIDVSNKKDEESSDKDQKRRKSSDETVLSRTIESLSLEGEDRLFLKQQKEVPDFLESTFPPGSPENRRHIQKTT